MDWNRLLCIDRISTLEEPIQERSSVLPDFRSEFTRDYDRSVFSTPVRRLQDKAQVFPLEPNDAVRTRLTHSLEVSTVARDLTRAAAHWMLEAGHVSTRQAHDIETVAATCGLIHDIGNPPFGHSGERAIGEWFQKQLELNENFFSDFGGTDDPTGVASQFAQDFLRFEGNAQTLRLVSKLQLLANLHGLNLTCGTLSAACKYVCPSHQADSDHQHHERAKPGYFASEEDLIREVRARTGTGEARNPITYLVEASDDIVYTVVDIEDGVKTGAVEWETFKKALREEAALIHEGNSDLLERCLDEAQAYITPHASQFGKPGRSAESQAFRNATIFANVNGVLETFKNRYDAIMAGEYHGELLYDPDGSTAVLARACRNAAKKLIYPNQKILKLEVMGRHVLHHLMSVFWEGASAYHGKDLAVKDFTGKSYNLMSRNYRLVFENTFNGEQKSMPEDYCRMQLVTDWICGMTDTFACTLYSQLTHA